MTGPSVPPKRPGESLKTTTGDQSTPQKQGEALRARGVQPGAASASGHAAAGSPTPKEDYHTPGEGAEEVQDTMLKPGQPMGKQKEPALFTATGSVEPGTIPTPSGPVPAAAIGDERLREAAIRAARAGLNDANRIVRNSRRRLTEEDLDRMSPAEIRAVASDRGYEMPLGGRRSVSSAFARAQKEDQSGLTDEGGQTPSEQRQSAPARTSREGVVRPPAAGGGEGSSVQIPAPGTTAAGTAAPTPPQGSGIEPR